MFYLKNFILLIFAFSSISCANTGSAKTSETKAAQGTIVRDCTGTYVNMDGKDYIVCNFKKLQNKERGAKISFTYEVSKDCPESDGTAVCMMYHEHAGMIRIVDVK